MKKMTSGVLVAMTMLSTPALAQECSIDNFCSDMSGFWLSLIRAEQRGNIVSITTQYNTGTSTHFTLDFSGETYAEIVDANGNIFAVDTRVTREIDVHSNGLTDASIRFVVDDTFSAPFDYYIVSDGKHGSAAITNIPVPFPN